MRYTWNEKDILVRKIELTKILRKGQLTKQEKNNIQNNLDLLSYMLDVLHRKEAPKKLLQPLLSKSLKHEYESIPTEIAKCIWNSQDIISTYDTTTPLPRLPIHSLSSRELVNLTYDFFEWIPNKNYAQLVRSYTSPENHLLHIGKFLTSYAGNVFPIYYPTYTPYILLNKSNTIEDFITLNHESAHSIYKVYDNRKKESLSFLFELEGYVFDKLSILFLLDKKIISKNLANDIEIQNIDKALLEIYNFYVTHIMIHLQKKHQLTRTNIQKCLLRIFDNIDFNIPTEVLKTTTYILSFFTFLDLDFEKDIELAFYKFEKIRNEKKKDILNHLRENGITFLDDNYQNLQKTMQKLHLTKKV